MRICASSSAAARPRAGRAKAGHALALLLGLVLAACTAPPPRTAEVPKPPREALPLDTAVLALADAVLARASFPADSTPPPRPLVIDPLIDRATGTETATTRAMSRRIADRVAAAHPDYALQPFTLASVAARPLVLLGSITGVVAAGSLQNATAAPSAYRIWAVLADLGSGTIVAHETAWVQVEEVDTAPTAFHRDSPAWLADPMAAAYLRVCAGNPGDAIDPAWLQALDAEVLLAEATSRYEAGGYEAALALFDRAVAAPAGEQLRSYNGRYLSAAALGRSGAAERAFGDLVDYGLARQQLAVKFLFRPGGAEYWPDPAISGAYPMWLRQIARHTAADAACLDVAGHASPTGSAAWNERLSLARAQRIRGGLLAEAASLAPRTRAVAEGARQPLVGTGRDDFTDVLDRRVGFRPRDCAALG